MQIATKTVKFLGNKITVYQVIRAGQVVHVAETAEAAAAWVAAQ